MTGAFTLTAALFQRERTGRGQRIDMAMLDVAMILMSSHLTGYLRNGGHPKPHGNRHPHTTDERDTDHAREIAVLSEIMLSRTADEWEAFLQARHVPAARVRTMGEALADPQLQARGLDHRHAAAAGLQAAF